MAPKYVRQKLWEMQGESNFKTCMHIIVSNIHLLKLDRSRRQKFSQYVENLSIAINQLNVIDVHRTLQPTNTEHNFFSFQ